VGKVAALQMNPTKGLMPWECRSLVTDAVLASFSLQSKGNQLPKRIPTSSVFGAFHQLKDKYPEWLSSLYFEKGAEVYVSKQLEDVLFALGAFGLVTVENHDYRYLSIDSEAKRQIKKQVLKRLSKHKLGVLKAMSNEFAGIVNR